MMGGKKVLLLFIFALALLVFGCAEPKPEMNLDDLDHLSAYDSKLGNVISLGMSKEEVNEIFGHKNFKEIADDMFLHNDRFMAIF